MNKQELLADLSGQSWVSAFLDEPDLVEVKSNGDKWYTQSIREIVGNVGTYRKISFYVVHEGEPDETAFYQHNEPRPSTVVVVPSRFITIRTLMNELGPVATAAIYTKIQNAAVTNPVLNLALSMLTTYSEGGGIDIYAQHTIDFIDAITPDILSLEEANAIKNLATH